MRMELTSGSNPQSLFKQSERNYLFGFVPSARTNKESYNRYIVFMKAITEVLNDFGIHISNNGYSYIIDSVMLIMDLRTLDLRLKTDVYPVIARKYDFKKYTTIEHNIRNAIKSACLDNERHPGANKMDIFGRRPTNKQFLLYVTEYVSRKMCEEMISLAG
ncbi:MAG: hypothetical protein IJH43_05290 [Mogibacterium sp.]|nr:hypothetical protein [Mogibacterium sp.]